MNKKTILKEREIIKKFKLGEIYLSSAQNSLENSDIRLSTDAAYNSAELVMKSAIFLKKESVPKRHKGVAQLFSFLYIKNGPFERKLGGIISEGLELRNKARYEADAKITKENAKHNIELAEKLIEYFSKKILTARKELAGLE